MSLPNVYVAVGAHFVRTKVIQEVSHGLGLVEDCHFLYQYSLGNVS